MRPRASPLPVLELISLSLQVTPPLPKKAQGTFFHLETLVGTAGDQYGLLTVTVLTAHAQITDGVRQDVTRTYGRN